MAQSYRDHAHAHPPLSAPRRFKLLAPSAFRDQSATES
jgi:hypothetical protein